MTDQELIQLGAAELARQIRCGQVNPCAVLEAHIRRIAAVNPAINALVTPTFEQARTEAQQAAERLAVDHPDNLPPLFGVPVTIKDALPVAGVRFTAGSIYRRDQVAGQDAEAVRRLRAAGAIVLGKTNCPDLSSSTETDNPVFGRTRNPWDLRRSAGGSSGGEGALIAAGGSPLGLGSDIAGSIRIPAAFCGVVGLKPTAGRIPTDGHIPQAPAPIHDWNTVGPLARRVEDLALALSVLSDKPVRDFQALALRGRKAIVPAFLPSHPPNREIRYAITQAARALEEAGMVVEAGRKLPLQRALFEYALVAYDEWFPSLRQEMGGGEPIEFWPDLLAILRGRGRIGAGFLPLLADLSLMAPLLRALGIGTFSNLERVRQEVLDAFGEGQPGVLLWPVYSVPAPRHGFSWGYYGLPAYPPVVNAMGLPAVALPVGFNKRGLPLGVQVIAAPGEDETALAVAAVLESRFGGWRMAPCTFD